MKSYWLELEQFIKDKSKQYATIERYPEYIGYAIIYSEMEQIKSEFYYQSLKEAGYF